MLVATNADEVDAIEDALALASERWESAALPAYAYRVRVDCECVDRGATWIRVFDPPEPEESPLRVEALYRRIGAALNRSPQRVEVAFDPDLGIPVWFAVEE